MRFAIASDLHIALPNTIWDHPSRFHLVELSIPVFEAVLSDLAQLDLDFLLLPGDLTQHGEPENHAWLSQRLAQLPYPVYVIPGNHDVPTVESLAKFAPYYTKFGYELGVAKPERLYYQTEILPGLRLIGLNSNQFDADGKQIGCMDDAQLLWLESALNNSSAEINDELVIVTIHHNVLEHMPGQASNPLGKRYMLDNADRLCRLLQRFGVRLIFTGHLHVQDVAYSDRYDLYDITTGSIVSYPHPYRVLTYADGQLDIHSHRITAVPGVDDLQNFSREWMGDRSHLFMLKLLTKPPLNLDMAIAETITPDLRYFWANLANGDAKFEFPQFSAPVKKFFEAFSDRPPADNNLVISL
jgi:3',5'-cyclic AMP phosphodiesterase CpdA